MKRGHLIAIFILIYSSPVTALFFGLCLFIPLLAIWHPEALILPMQVWWSAAATALWSLASLLTAYLLLTYRKYGVQVALVYFGLTGLACIDSAMTAKETVEAIAGLSLATPPAYIGYALTGFYIGGSVICAVMLKLLWNRPFRNYFNTVSTCTGFMLDSIHGKTSAQNASQ